MYVQNDIMYILASTFGGIIYVNTHTSCIHVQCLSMDCPDYRGVPISKVRLQWLCVCSASSVAHRCCTGVPAEPRSPGTPYTRPLMAADRPGSLCREQIVACSSMNLLTTE